ncbi:MAG: hypothetical protein ACKO0Z_24565 [Betaproteobacteria bacterium]
MGSQVIREATEGDIPQLLAMGEEFITSAGHEFDAEVAEKTLRNLILSDTSVILVNDKCTAMIGGLVYQNFFGKGIVAQELFWWASSNGLALLQAFEDWAKDMGADKVMMICLEKLSPERVGKIYMRRGYSPLEHSYVRAI